MWMDTFARKSLSSDTRRCCYAKTKIQHQTLGMDICWNSKLHKVLDDSVFAGPLEASQPPAFFLEHPENPATYGSMEAHKSCSSWWVQGLCFDQCMLAHSQSSLLRSSQT